MEINFTAEQLAALSEESALKRRALIAQAKIDLLEEMGLEASYPEKLECLEKELDEIAGCLLERGTVRIADIVDVGSRHGHNAFNWPVTTETLLYHALGAVKCYGELSQAAEEMVGLSPRSKHAYGPEEG